MAGFLDKYEDVAARIMRLHATYPHNRVETHIIDFDGSFMVNGKIYGRF